MRLCRNEPDTHALIDYSEGPHRHRRSATDEHFPYHNRPAATATGCCYQCLAIVTNLDQLFPTYAYGNRP
jgi:hypothetical protein